ncbi:uncharacterized protein CDV56_104993 [Aspergillus thermomutatus]|uniref:Major facilitator superfamily (MFS) profile domain-containing protein n=1 Tax=Aspergillus thermomutatus TaxID=41047 RepID=A0A397GF07_ASPTH|nr:uncharacterized protein CDV56_104993 [Aspergillus thermomutatus]RHZ49047.1 hypothetical protein CDV56_104993 [Aspergillus thermomutatus]
MIIINSFFTCICWIPLVVAYPLETVTTKQRSIYFAITLLTINVTAFVTSYLTPVGIADIGWRYYMPTAVWNAIMVIIIYFTFIETKGLTLEEIATLFDGDEDFVNSAIAVSHDMGLKRGEFVVHDEVAAPNIACEKQV